MFDFPDICTKSTSWDRDDAGWYVHNSANVRDISPDWRHPGGGVVSSNLTQDLNEAFEQAIVYTRHRIEAAEKHLKKLEKAKKEWGEEKN